MIPDDIKSRLVTAVREGRYSLLLGAGFSANSLSMNGIRLPVGEKLRDELAAHFQLPSYYPLAQIASTIDDTKPGQLAQYLVDRFSNCTPSAGVASIPKFVWRSVFTFNIDDALTGAFLDARNAPKQRIREFTHKSVFEFGDWPLEVPLVNLHGSVRRASDGFTFSLKDYGDLMREGSTWFQVLGDILLDTPFIVAGYSLFDPDLEFFLRRRQDQDPSHRASVPSVFVTRSMDAVKHAQCQRFGLTPVEADSDEFFLELGRLSFPIPEAAVLVRPKGSSPFASPLPAGIEATFYRQWLPLNASSLPDDRDTPPRLLVEGVEPRWSHIVNLEDVVRSITSDYVADVGAWAAEAASNVRFSVVLTSPGQGRSTALMRTAVELSRAHDVFYYVGNERLQPDIAFEALQHARRGPVVIVDNVWSHGHQVVDLASRLAVAGQPAYFIVAERQSFRRQLSDALSNLDRKIVFHRTLAPLSNSEALALVMQMRAKGALGAAAVRSDAEVARSLHGHDLVTCILLLNRNALHLAAVLRAEAEELEREAKRLYHAICLAHACGHSLRLAIAQRALNLDTRTLMRSIDSLIALRLVTRDSKQSTMGEFWRSRHRVVAEAVLDLLTGPTKLELFVGIANAVRPYVSRDAMVKGTAESGLSSQLLDYDRMVRPHLGSLSQGFYESVGRAWTWNSRYWSQLALLKLEQNNLPTALQHAEQAVSVEKHPTTYTTLAKVLFAQARAHALGVGAPGILEAALAAVESALEAGRRRRRVDVHPYDVGIRGVVEYCRRRESNGEAIVLPGRVVSTVDELVDHGGNFFRTRDQQPLIEAWRQVKVNIRRQ